MVRFPLLDDFSSGVKSQRRYVFTPFVDHGEPPPPPSVSTGVAAPIITDALSISSIKANTSTSKDAPVSDIVQVQTITKRLVQYSSYLEQRIQKSGAKAAGFACLRTGQDGTMVVRINNYNTHLTVPLEKLLTLYGAKLSGDSLDDFRTRSLRRFIDFIKSKYAGKSENISIILDSIETAVTFYEHFGFKWTTTGKKYDEVFHIDETNVNEHFIMVYKL